MNASKLYINKGLLSSVDFIEKYGLSDSIVAQYYRLGDKNIIKIKSFLYVNEKALIKRRDFHTKIWNKAHENYYAITEFVSDYTLATLLSKTLGNKPLNWNMYMRTTLFDCNFQDKSLFCYEVPKMLWAFYRATTFIIRRLLRYETLVECGKMKRIKSGGLKDIKNKKR